MRWATLSTCDYTCFQRGFDDHRQVRIRLEATACGAGADVVLTCDDEFLSRAPRAAPKLTVLNFVDYVRTKQGEW